MRGFKVFSNQDLYLPGGNAFTSRAVWLSSGNVAVTDSYSLMKSKTSEKLSILGTIILLIDNVRHNWLTDFDMSKLEKESGLIVVDNISWWVNYMMFC